MAEEVRRQGAPNQEEPQPDAPDAESVVAACERVDVEPDPFVPTGPVLDRAPLPVVEDASKPLLPSGYRQRGTAPRDQVKSSRYTAVEFAAIQARAREWSLKPAGFIAEAAVQAAADDTGMIAADDRATRAVAEAIARLTRELNRIGVNLNQIAHACNAGSFPDRAEAVVDEVAAAVAQLRTTATAWIKE
ncbi:MobC family plasmid mobilization relaxosome protein [Streptomyces fildesensis]|uniref:MobC family plasmid mobilization relaxosome protein n=1 Tax=Streptomyces fildesensis TaxID=375757 RepID=UPI0018E04BAF|nr:MobC family plasmid mobilization relaxosome protein [Streptomyces fildesensis]